MSARHSRRVPSTIGGLCLVLGREPAGRGFGPSGRRPGPRPRSRRFPDSSRWGDPAESSAPESGRRVAPERTERGERRWPMAAAVLVAGVLRTFLPPELRVNDARGVFLVLLVVLMVVLIIGDPGRIDRQARWLRNLTGALIGLITLVNGGSSVKLVISIIYSEPFTQTARVLLACGGIIWLTNVIAFGLWYWDLDRGGPAARAAGSTIRPAFLFPEMSAPEHVREDWYPTFVDYLHLSFNTAMAFSPTDVSAIKPWAKVMMMAEEGVSVVVGVLVVARAVNILT